MRPLRRSPTGLQRSALQRWRHRLTPTTSHDAWRGHSPRLNSALTHAPLPLLRAGAVFSPTGGGQRAVAAGIHRGWLILAPMRVPGPGAASSGFRVTALVAKFLCGVVRGVMGVCRLKLRYKGKSFKWHRRRGALLLRFGHAHLVHVRAFPGLRWRRFGRMKIMLYGTSL